jgi:trigger factor
MRVQVSDWTETQKKVTVEIPANEVQPEIEKRYRQVAKKAYIKGFRPGKAPISLIKSLYGKAIEGEVAQDFINKTFPEVLETQQIKPLAQADLEDFHYTEEGGLVYITTVEVPPSFEATGYKGIELEAPRELKAIDELLEEELERLRNENAAYVHLKNESVAEGLVAVCDITRSDMATGHSEEDLQDGEKELQDMEIEVGSGKFNSEIERQIIGMKPGETWLLEITFGDDAPVKTWCNQTVKLEITLKEILKKQLPDLNDDLAKEIGYSSLDELKEALRNRIEKMREDNRRYFLETQVQKKLIEIHNFPLPEKAVERKIEEQISNLRLQFERQGIRLPAEVFQSAESKERMKPEAEMALKLDLIMDKIAQQEGITLSQEEEQEIVDSLVKMLGDSGENMREEIPKHPYFEKLKEAKLYEKTMNWIIENAVIVENSKGDDTEKAEDKLENDNTQGEGQEN